MKIFTNNAFDDGDGAIQIAALQILEQRESLGSEGEVWSLAELRSDYEDYQWLQKWAEHLDARTADRWLKGQRSISDADISGPAAIGLLLLFLFAEKARRDASEANLWSVLAGPPFLFGPATRERIFSPYQNYPRSRVQQALEAAAYRFNLRHVFSQAEDVQAWKGLIFLQFGFSLRGAKAQLPNWLAGFRPQGANRLFRGHLRSQSFRELWQTLTEYRQDHISTGRFHAYLQACPWVLAEWLDEIARQCHRKRELGTRGLEEEERDPVFAERPEIVWRAGTPAHFRARLKPDEILIDQPGTYRLSAGSAEVGVLLVDEQGARLDPPGTYFSIPRASPSVAITVVDASGASQASMALELFSPATDVILCSWNGETAVLRGDGYESVPPSKYALLTARDLILRPETEWSDVEGCALRLHLVESDVPELIWEGNTVWRPLSKGRDVSTEPEWARSVRVEAKLQRRRLQPVVHHPSGCRVRWARALGNALDPEALTDASTRFSSLLAPNETQLCFTLGVERDGEVTILRRTVPTRPSGAWLLGGSGWEALNPDLCIEAELLSSTRLKVELEKDDRAFRSRWSIVEGQRILGALPPGTTVVSGAAGLGANLRLHPDRFHPLLPDMLLGNVIDSGLLQEVVEESEGVWLLRLKRPHEPDRHSKVFWWGEGGEPTILDPEEVASCAWRVEASSEPFAVAIVYAGERLGAWFCEGWWAVAAGWLPSLEMAQFIRWLRPPILLDAARTGVTQLIEKDPVRFLLGSLLDIAPPAGLCWSESRDAAWKAAVRELVWDWTPTDKQGGSLARDFAGIAMPELTDKEAMTKWALQVMSRSTYELALWHPLLGARLLHPRMPKRGLIASRLIQKLGTDEGQLIDQCCKHLGESFDTPADERFILRSLIEPALPAAGGHRLNPECDHRLQMAVFVEPFRKLLALRLFQAIAKAA